VSFAVDSIVFEPSTRGFGGKGFPRGLGGDSEGALGQHSVLGGLPHRKSGSEGGQFKSSRPDQKSVKIGRKV